MRADNAVGLTQVTGAAASIRSRWPTDETNGGNVLSLAHLGTTPVWAWTATSYAAGTQTQLVFAGSDAVAFQSTAAGGNGYGVTFNARTSFFTELTGGPVIEDCCCWSIRATIAYPVPVGASLLDHGIFIYAGVNNSMFANGTNKAAVQFGATGPAEVRLRAIQAQGGPVTVNDIVPSGLTPNLALYNTYELRVISGSNVQLPQVFGLINGQIVTPRRPWGAAAALLPGPAAQGGGFFGYTLGALNISAGNYPNMYVHEVVVTAAQSERDLF